MGEMGFGGDSKRKAKPSQPAPRVNLGKHKKKQAKTKRQRKVLDALKKGMSPTEAVRVAGYAPSVINNPKIVLDSAAVKAEIVKFQEDICAAFPNERLIKTLDAGLEATQVKVACIEGQITDIKAFVDHTERRQTVELIAEMSGRLNRKESGTQVGVQVIVEHIGGNQDQVAAQAAALVVSPRPN